MHSKFNASRIGSDMDASEIKSLREGLGWSQKKLGEYASGFSGMTKATGWAVNLHLKLSHDLQIN